MSTLGINSKREYNGKGKGKSRGGEVSSKGVSIPSGATAEYSQSTNSKDYPNKQRGSKFKLPSAKEGYNRSENTKDYKGGKHTAFPTESKGESIMRKPKVL